MNATFTSAATVAQATATTATQAPLLPTQLLPILNSEQRVPAGESPRFEGDTAYSEPRFPGDRTRESAQSR
jgi:hypothetical protein